MGGIRKRDLWLGLVVLAIPTFASVWAAEIEAEPSWWPSWPSFGLLKLFATAAWAACASIIVSDGLKRDRTIEKLTAEAQSKRETLRNQALQQSLDGMLQSKPAFPKKWDFTVYIFDADDSVLLPVYPRPDDEAILRIKTFQPGQGATGQAWSDETTIFRMGSSVSDATYGLTEDQQAHFEARGTVASTPIFSDIDEKIGVLSVICDGEDALFNSPAGQAQLRETASSIGTLFVALSP